MSEKPPDRESNFTLWMGVYTKSASVKVMTDLLVW